MILFSFLGELPLYSNKTRWSLVLFFVLFYFFLGGGGVLIAQHYLEFIM